MSAMVQFDLSKLFRAVSPMQRLANLGVRPDLARAAGRMVSDERSDAEVAALQRGLNADESVIALVEGRHERRLGLLALTTERILFRAHRSAPRELIVFDLAAIRSVQARSRGLTSTVSVQVLESVGESRTESTFEVDKVLGLQGSEFGEAVGSQLATPGPRPESDPLQELSDLRARSAAGTVQNPEYEAEKTRLLARIQAET
jgi:hypothetical protein